MRYSFVGTMNFLEEPATSSILLRAITVLHGVTSCRTALVYFRRGSVVDVSTISIMADGIKLAIKWKIDLFCIGVFNLNNSQILIPRLMT